MQGGGQKKKNMKSSKANEVECRDLSCSVKAVQGWRVLREGSTSPI